MWNVFWGKLFGIFVSKYDGKLQIILQDTIIVSKKNKAYIKYWAIRGQQKNIWTLFSFVSIYLISTCEQ